MPRTELAYTATQQHVRLLAAKRARLHEAQLEAEDQLVFMVAREFNEGRIGWAELEDAYESLRNANIPGFRSRFNKYLPFSINRIRLEVARSKSDQWSGSWPYAEGDVLPIKGTCVVYVLFDETAEPCYVGSTFKFRSRMNDHAAKGKRWTSWVAYRCRDRDHAYEVEDKFLQQFKPYLNKQARAYR